MHAFQLKLTLYPLAKDLDVEKPIYSFLIIVIIDQNFFFKFTLLRVHDWRILATNGMT
jgi:hypothetical protein